MESKTTVEQIDWISQLKETVPRFLERMKGTTTPGFFRYSLSGDFFGEEKHWGLGNTIFATKIYYTLGALDTLPQATRDEMKQFILSFQLSDGVIFDPLIARRAYWRDKLSTIKHRDFQNFSHTQTVRAETRQALSALNLLGVKLTVYPENLPHEQKGVILFLERLDWTRPWSAGSHFSHLLFFLAQSDLAQKQELIDTAVEWLGSIADPQTGCWFKGNPSLQQKINGAMKVLTGLKAADRVTIANPQRLIDTALGASNDRQACDHFNVVYVLKYAREAVDKCYHEEEIRRFVLNRLEQYQSYYWPEVGGFSYFLGKSNDIYYNAAVSRGLAEPDIHGTVLFLWGIALLLTILDLDQEMGYKEFVT